MNNINSSKQYETTEDFLDPNPDVSPKLSQRAYLNILEDMQEERSQMEDQRIAIFNIMEDITEAQKELKKRYQDLDVIKELVQDLGTSLKTTVVLDRLIEALKKTLPPPINLAYVMPSPNPDKLSDSIYIHTTTQLSKKYLNAIKENLKISFDVLPVSVKRKSELLEWISGEFLFKFIEGTIYSEGQSNEMSISETLLPLSSFSVPLLVRDDILGMINISSPEPNLFLEKDINLANTMAGATASTISRLRQLLESEQSRIQSLVESLSNGVVMFDLDQKVTMSNPFAQRVTGLPAQGFFLSELTKLFVGAKVADKESFLAFEEKINETLRTGKALNIEEANISRFSYEIYITPVRDYEKKIIGGALILHDITHIKEIDQMKTEFVSIASHQLRTPLTPLRLFSEMLLSEEAGKLNPKQREYVDTIQKSAKRMIVLVNDLLNVSRLETGRLKVEPVPTDIVKFIQGVVDELTPTINNEKCEIMFNKPKEKLQKINIDLILMRQVIHNLLTNAIRYSPEKGSIITIDIKVEASDYLVSVRDNGIGIPKDIQSRVFEKFFRADNAIKTETEGSGLGMYVAKMVMEASGGKLWFESPPQGEDHGTIFYVSIPQNGMVRKEGRGGLQQNDN